MQFCQVPVKNRPTTHSAIWRPKKENAVIKKRVKKLDYLADNPFISSVAIGNVIRVEVPMCNFGQVNRGLVSIIEYLQLAKTRVCQWQSGYRVWGL